MTYVERERKRSDAAISSARAESWARCSASASSCSWRASARSWSSCSAFLTDASGASDSVMVFVDGCDWFDVLSGNAV